MSLAKDPRNRVVQPSFFVWLALTTAQKEVVRKLGIAFREPDLEELDGAVVKRDPGFNHRLVGQPDEKPLLLRVNVSHANIFQLGNSNASLFCDRDRKPYNSSPALFEKHPDI